MTRQIATLLPIRHFEGIAEDMDRAFNALYGGSWNGHALGGVSLAPVDIVEKDGSILFTASVPGLKPEEVEVTIEDDVLTLKGEFNLLWESDENAKVYRREIRSGSFTRSFQLPENLDLEKVDAAFDNGLATIRIPIKVEPKPEPLRIALKKAEY